MNFTRFIRHFSARSAAVLPPILLSALLLCGCGLSPIENSGDKPASELGSEAETAPSPAPSPPVPQAQQPPESEPQAPATPSAAPAPAPIEKSPVETLLESLTLEQKIGQLFMLAFRADESGENTMTEFNSTMSEALERYNPAGVILFSENISTKGQVSKLIGDLQEHSNIPLFIAVDEEGGKVSRIGGLYEEKIPDAVETASAEEARARGEELGRRLSELGFNMDFAPVADINTNPNNTVIGSRAFSDDPATAAEYVSAFSEAMLGTGVIPVAKHFPGHGDTGEDSHQGMAVFRHGLDRLMEYEIKPFAAGIDAGACVLVGHISAPEITGDALPATFSRELVTGILRGRLGYDGLVITDAMDMGAITEYYPPGEAAVLAIEAGVDIVLMPGDVDAAYNGVLEAVAEERLTEERIDQSVLRVLGLKTSARRASAP